MKRPLLLALLLALPAVAGAQTYRLPLEDCSDCAHAPLYPTAYMDLDTRVGSFQDWDCQSLSYDGHKGTDIAIGGWVYMDQGSMEVVAAAAGEVIYAHDGEFDRCASGSCGDGTSNSVALRHADGKVTSYLHMKNGSVAVAVGDRVSCGQLLGRVGSSGWSSGPHVHFEVNLGRAFLIDPDDPFASSCGAGGTLTYWRDQGSHGDLPGSLCDGQVGTTTASSTTASSTATATASTASTATSTTTSSSSTSTTGGTGTTGTSSTTSSSTRSTATASTSTSSSTRSTSTSSSTTASSSTATASSTTGGGTTGGTVASTAAAGTTGGNRDLCNFVSETVADGTVFAPGARFDKTWLVRNDGDTRWSQAGGYRLQRESGDVLGAAATVEFGSAETVDPGRTKGFGVPIQLPSTPGTYRQSWRMYRGSSPFGATLSLEVLVRPATDADRDGHARKAEGGDDCDDTRASVFPGAPEQCNAIDDDCDDLIDEGLVRRCVGACGAGTQLCVAGSYGDCTAEGGSPESCNALDDDCDGLIDDGAPCPSNQFCSAGHCIPTGLGATASTVGSSGGGAGGSTEGGTAGSIGEAPASPGGCGCSGAGELAPTIPLVLLAAGLPRRRRRT